MNSSSSSSRPTAGKDLDLKNFLLRFLDLIIHQEVPKLFFQQDLRGLVDKTTAQQPKVQQFETDHRQELGVRKVHKTTAQQRHLVSNTMVSAGELGSLAPGSSGSQQQRHLVSNTASSAGDEVKRERGGSGSRIYFPAKKHILSFLAGNFFWRSAPPFQTQYLVARILNWRPVYRKTLLLAFGLNSDFCERNGRHAVSSGSKKLLVRRQWVVHTNNVGV